MLRRAKILCYHQELYSYTAERLNDVTRMEESKLLTFCLGLKAEARKAARSCAYYIYIYTKR